MNILVDTCVILDALQDRVPFSEDAKRLFLSAANREFEAFVPAKSVADLYYILHRSLHSDEQTRTVLKKLFNTFHISDTTAQDCRNAFISPIADFEDAILAESALRSNMHYIVTRNIKDYKHSSIPAVLPTDFLNML